MNGFSKIKMVLHKKEYKPNTIKKDIKTPKYQK